VSVGTSDITDLVVAVRAGVTLAGRFVYDGSTRMVAVTASAGARGGQPASLGVMASPMARPERPPVVELEPADGAPQLGLPRSNPLDADVGEDRFLVPGLKAGEYVLRVASYGDRFSVKLIIVNGVDYTHRPIDASMLDAQSEVELVLTDQVNTVTGVVRNPSGPTLDAAVIAFPVERDEWSRYGYSPVRIRATMVSGTTGYSMRGLPAGEYFLVAVDRTLMTAWQDPAFLERAAGQASRLTLEWGEAKVVDLDLVRVR
jgi:hypothetical protein